MEQLMPDLLSAMEYSNYISPVKLVIFLALFFPVLFLLKWVYDDADSVGTKKEFWTSVIFGTWAAAAIIWLLIPIFIAGVILYVIAIAATAISYVLHRNSRVPEFNRILTIDHIKGLSSKKSEKGKTEVQQGFLFITANNNEVPMPEARTPDFFGYKAAYDLFKDAQWRRSENITFSPTAENYNVTYNVDGTVTPQPAVSKDQMDYMIRFIKHLADMDPEEKRKPQKGKFYIRQNKQDTEWKVSTAGSTAGEQVALKQITKHTITKLADLGLAPDQLEQLGKLPSQKQGVFLVSGQKKNGVTTTFYALLRAHDAFINSINTLERQPASDLPNITQNVFTLGDTGTTTYAKKLQGIIRMGPDIVGVSDVENTETAQVAVAGAKDNKIIYVTLEADGVMQALAKWIKLVGDKNLAAQTLLGISNQRLMRVLCNDCKEEYEPNKDLLKKFNIPADRAKVLYRAVKEQFDKKGRPIVCETCQGTGFVGRTGIFETIVLDDELRKAIAQSATLSEIGTQFRRAKMFYLQERALRKVIDGTTAINEMVRILSTSKEQKPQVAAKPKTNP